MDTEQQLALAESDLRGFLAHIAQLAPGDEDPRLTRLLARAAGVLVEVRALAIEPRLKHALETALHSYVLRVAVNVFDAKQIRLLSS